MPGAYLGPATDFYRQSDLSMTYTDYLQRRELDDRLAVQITEPMRELVTVSEEAFGAQLRQLEHVEAAVANAGCEIVCSVRDLQQATEEGFRRVNSILEWGFDAILVQLGGIRDLLSDIRHLLENPSLTWAYEQFNRARDLYRRGHYGDALIAVDFAINGHGSNLGERTEHRFHFLRGVIRLGSFGNHNPEVVDLADAERAFLAAANYAGLDCPQGCAQAWLSACRAANLQGKYPEAVEYGRKGLAALPSPALHYEIARALLQVGQADVATQQLLNALRLDQSLLLKALGDPAFDQRGGFLEQTLAQLLGELREIAAKAETLLDHEITTLAGISYVSPLSGEHSASGELKDAAAHAATALRDRLAALQERGGIADIRAALDQLPELWLLLEAWNAKFVAFVQDRLRNEGASRRSEIGEGSKVPYGFGTAPMNVGIAVGAIVFVIRASHVWYLLTHPNIGSFEDMIGAILSAVFYPLVLGAVAWGVASLIAGKIKDSIEADQADRVSAREAIDWEASQESARIAAAGFYRPAQGRFEALPGWAIQKGAPGARG